jgi:hypothetical protein
MTTILYADLTNLNAHLPDPYTYARYKFVEMP